MNMKTVIIFAIVGAVCLLIVAGGIVSMRGESPDSVHLASGAVVGAGAGAGLAYWLGPIPELETLQDMVGGQSEMNVGLPTF